MTYSEKFGGVASKLTKKFSEEFGKATIYSVVGEVYDPATGVNQPSGVVEYAYMVFDEIAVGGKYTNEYVFDHGLAIVAGDDLSITPKEGDTITKTTGTTHKIVFVENDQYSAAYFCHIQKKPV